MVVVVVVVVVVGIVVVEVGLGIKLNIQASANAPTPMAGGRISGGKIVFGGALVVVTVNAAVTVLFAGDKFNGGTVVGIGRGSLNLEK